MRCTATLFLRLRQKVWFLKLLHAREFTERFALKVYTSGYACVVSGPQGRIVDVEGEYVADEVAGCESLDGQCGPIYL